LSPVVFKKEKKRHRGLAGRGQERWQSWAKCNPAGRNVHSEGKIKTGQKNGGKKRISPEEGPVKTLFPLESEGKRLIRGNATAVMVPMSEGGTQIPGAVLDELVLIGPCCVLRKNFRQGFE